MNGRERTLWTGVFGGFGAMLIGLIAELFRWVHHRALTGQPAHEVGRHRASRGR